MKPKHKASVAVGIAVMAVAGAVLVPHQHEIGYRVEQQGDGKYSVYKDGKIFGKDLDNDQANHFREKK